ncbi:hypothetical protein V8C42DRAFT_360757 [Trichoderma barbatum]
MVSPSTTLWFVDERYKRKAIAPTEKQLAVEEDRRVFYGTDRRYVEVMSYVLPLDHDQWELLPQTMLGMTDPPICPPGGTGGHMWTWTEDLVGGDGLHWSGEWFIDIIKHYITSKVKAQDKRGNAGQKGKPDGGESKNSKPSDGETNNALGLPNNGEPNGDKMVYSMTGNDTYNYKGTEAQCFGLLACEFY